MGIPIMSDCRCDNCSCDKREEPATFRAGDPDPHRFTVLRTRAAGTALAAEVQYDGCTNYEGHKILVYGNMTNGAFLRLEQLDPHFCDNPRCVSPVARFEPTERGWALALAVAAMLGRPASAFEQ